MNDIKYYFIDPMRHLAKKQPKHKTSICPWTGKRWKPKYCVSSFTGATCSCCPEKDLHGPMLAVLREVINKPFSHVLYVDTDIFNDNIDPNNIDLNKIYAIQNIPQLKILDTAKKYWNELLITDSAKRKHVLILLCRSLYQQFWDTARFDLETQYVKTVEKKGDELYLKNELLRKSAILEKYYSEYLISFNNRLKKLKT